MRGVSKKRICSGFNRKLNRKGQFTLFIIVGLVIFFVFGFALYARTKILNAQMAQQADTQLKDYLSKNSINQYVTSCLDVVSDDVFLTASMQGGLLNDTGKIAGQDYILYNDSVLNKTFEVAIVIDANTNCPDGSPIENYLVTQEPGLYPYNCANEYLNNLPTIYTRYGDDRCHNNCTTPDFRKYSGFFGINRLPMLCSLIGANAPGIATGDNSLTCDYYDYNRSMQQILEEQVANDIGKCVNFTEMLKRTPSNITQVGNVTTIITFNQGSYNVKLRYPFTIIMRNKQPVTKLIDFSIDRDVPFKDLYEYTYELANYDVKDAKFYMVDDKDEVISAGIRRRGANIYNSNFIINIIQGNTDNNFTNIIQVTDLEHRLRGIPLTINLGVKNRRPALDYIRDGRSPIYDLAAIENRTITLSPQGYDPDDERTLLYTYGGWLQDYIEYYNWSDSLCAHPQTFEYILENCTKVNTSATAKQIWTNSSLYKTTLQNASYNATNSDIGLHKVIIRVIDRNGLDDYQEVRILVFDLPIAKINGSNYYDDVENNRASYEDLYVLNGSASSVGVIGATLPGVALTNFSWNDSTEPFAMSKDIVDTASMALLIPNDTDGIHLINIMNITSYTFKRKLDGSGNIITSTIHEISLTVKANTGLSGSNTYYVNVTQCLNHSNPSNYAYPYNNNPNDLSDALMADHTCCGPDMMYRGVNAECYRKVYYGLNSSLKDYHATVDNPTYDITYDPLPSPPDRYDNDIFMQTFFRNCASDRGNTCTGLITEVRTDVAPCEDDNGLASRGLPNNPAFTERRCSGPDPSYIAPNTYSDTPLTCMPYTGHTFEEYAGTANDNVCTQSKQCSDGTSFQHYNPSIIAKFKCDGTCTGDGACNTALNPATTCTCENGCNTPINGACLGRPFPGNGAPNTRSCSGAGETYYEDTCNDCGLIDALPHRCRANGFGINDCSATSQCNDIFPNTNPTITRCFPGTNWLALCNTTCKMVAVNDNICRTGTGCSAVGDNRCNNTRIDQKITTGVGANDNAYCTPSCTVGYCPNNFRRMAGNAGCYGPICTIDSECIPTYTCQGGSCLP